MFQGTTGDWEIHPVGRVTAYIEEKAGHPDLSSPRAQSDAIRPEVEDLIERARSVAAKIPAPHDDYVKEHVEQLRHLKLPDVRLPARVQMRGVTGQIMTRDAQAVEGGAQAAGHQIAIANVMYIRSPYEVARDLAKVRERVGRHLGGGADPGHRRYLRRGPGVVAADQRPNHQPCDARTRA